MKTRKPHHYCLCLKKIKTLKCEVSEKNFIGCKRREIDNVCEKINKKEILQSGSILLHTSSIQQTKTILNIT